MYCCRTASSSSPKHLGFVGLSLGNKPATTYLVFQAKNLVYFRGRGLIKFVSVTSVVKLHPQMLKICSFSEESCVNLVCFKIVVLTIQIKTKITTILKQTRIAQLAS